MRHIIRHPLRWKFARFAVRMLMLAGLAVPAHAAPLVRIMPLGDSITEGSAWDSPDGSGGYRGRLYSLLTTAGYTVDCIGSQTVNSSLIPDQNHEGHPG